MGALLLWFEIAVRSEGEEWKWKETSFPIGLEIVSAIGKPLASRNATRP
jgi:hypothetical protein